MNQQELESLPYPMFKTNWYEKFILRHVLKQTSIKFVCNRLRHLWLPTGSILAKIEKSLGNSLSALESFLHSKGFAEPLDFGWDLSIELRRIWINKLLAYKGE